MTIASIIAQVEVAIDPIIAEAKAIAAQVATGAFTYLKGVAITAAQKAVALIKETSLGTAIMNLISAASLTTGTGADKFAAVIAAAEAAYTAFVGAGGLSGLISAGLSVLRQVAQSLFDDFTAAFLAKVA